MSDEELEQTAILYIRNYLNKDFTDLEITTNHALAIKRLVAKLKDLDELPQGILSTKSNDVSITYLENNSVIMSKDITMLLPKPYIRLF